MQLHPKQVMAIQRKHSFRPTRLQVMLLLLCFNWVTPQQQAMPPVSYGDLFNTCPPEEKMQPCTCLPESREIVCGSGPYDANTLRYIFSEASPSPGQSSTGQMLFSHLIFEKSSIEKLASKSFGNFAFFAITIREHYYLSEFEEDAFVPSNRVTRTLKFDKMSKLGAGNASVYSLFSAVQSFTSLEVLVIHHCALSFLPPNAFGEPASGKLKHLKRISLMHNFIKTIHRNALSGPPMARFVSLSHNKIDKIEPFGITLQSRCTPETNNYETPYYAVDLSNNQLTPYSLNFSSIQLDCAADLNLSNNSITFLPQSVYRPLFTQFLKINLYGNQLDCANCHMAWLTKGRFCPSFNSTIRYQNLVESACEHTVTLSEFKSKCGSLFARKPSPSTSEPPPEPITDDWIESDVDLLQCPLYGPNASAQLATSDFLPLLLLLLVAFMIL